MASIFCCAYWASACMWTTVSLRLPFHFSLSCTGGGNGSPLQRSCLENPRDGGAWWAAVHGVAQSRTRLRRLSDSSSSFSISPSNEYSGLISFRIDLFDLLAVQGTLKSLLQDHSSKASVLQCSLWSSSHIHS